MQSLEGNCSHENVVRTSFMTSLHVPAIGSTTQRHIWWLVELPMWLTDGFSVTFLEGGGEQCTYTWVTCSSHASRAAHMWQTTIWWRGALTHGSCVSRVAINVHVATIWWRGALTCGSHVSRVAINVHITTIWWRGALMCGSCVSRVAINVHVTTIWWRGPSRVAHVCHVWQLMCTLLLYGGGEPSCVAHMCHMWQLTCTLLLYGGGGPNMWLTCVTCGN